MHCQTGRRKNSAVVFVTTAFSLTSNQHDADGEDLFRVGVRGDVPKTYTGQTAEGEIQSCDVLVLDGGT